MVCRDFLMQNWLKLSSLAFLAHLILVAAVEIDNGLIGDPEVECSSNTVEMQFRTDRPFRGKVFVKGHYNNPNCKVDYSTGSGSRPTGGIVVRHGECDMDRQRIINPQGMQFSSVVVVSFHATFITKIDRAFHIKCMYRELDKTVTSNIQVSQLTTEILGHDFPMPVCTYSIRKDEIDGEVLRYAKVGEQVVHRWECQSDIYGILVHSCFVEDGQGEKVEIVDERGCHVDQYLLGDPTYIEDLSMAYRESHVFKFADRVAVRFQCQIRVCMKEDDGCRGVTPPICPGNRRLLNEPQIGESAKSDDRFLQNSQHRIARREVESKDVFSKRPDFKPVDGDFNSQFIYVLDSTEDPERKPDSEDENDSEASALTKFLARANGAIVSEVQNNICLTTVTFTILLSSVTVVFLAAAFVAVVLCCQKLKFRKSNRSDMESMQSSCYTNVRALWNSD